MQKGTVTVRKKLLQMREEILEGIDQSRKSERSAPSRDVGDFYDDVDIEKGRQMVHMLGERDRKKLNDINSALERIEDEIYGICEECGCDINKKRLKVQPFARFCIKCQEDIEKRGGLDEDSMEEKILYKDVSISDIDNNES